MPVDVLLRCRRFIAPADAFRRRHAPWFAVAVYAALFGYVTWFRVAGISGSFLLLGDQIRDWTFALGPASDLPLTGAPSMAGGRALGPIYYWLLWLSRVAIGPFVDNLPHAGGIGLSLVQGCADLVLLRALWSRLGSGALAVAVVLLLATSPADAAVTASVWNPQVAVAFVKVAVALVLIGGLVESRPRQMLTAAAAWLALQGHSSALPVVSAILAWLVLRHLLRRRVADALWAAYDVVSVVLVLQLPFFLHHMIYGAARGGGPGRAAGALAGLWSGDAWSMIVDSAMATSAYLVQTLFAPWSLGVFGVLGVVAITVLLAATRRDNVEWVFVAVLPLLASIVLYAPMAERRGYWYLALAPAAGLAIGRALSLVQGRGGRLRWVAWACLVLVLVAQPGRFAQSRLLGRFPYYGAMVKGARQIVRAGLQPRSIGATFELDTSDPEFVFRVLGGRLDPQSRLDAQIEPGGGVFYREAGR